MPFKSEKQKKYLAINEPEVYNKYKEDSKKYAGGRSAEKLKEYLKKKA